MRCLSELTFQVARRTALHGTHPRRAAAFEVTNCDLKVGGPDPSGFPEDFIFQLTTKEVAALRLQIATSKGRGGRRYAPYVFTEQGVAMLSGVLRSRTAVTVNIAIMRAFVELRRAAWSYDAIERRLTEMGRERKERFGKHDQQLADVFEALRQLISPPPRPKRRLGFGLPEDKG